MNTSAKKTKVALVSIHSKNNEDIPPLGLLYIATALKKSGIDVKIFHINESFVSQFEIQIAKYSPDLIGMSVFTGYFNKLNVELSKTLKQKGFKIAWGNAHPSILPNEVLKKCIC